MEATSLISPKKDFILPSYAERHARIVDSSRRLLRWESKGIRTKRGPDGKFSSSRFVDDEASDNPYLDVDAESTSASGSPSFETDHSDGLFSASGSSPSAGSGSEGSLAHSDPPVDFVSFQA
ncbi:unnamed protein product [Calypogeia fissa]